MLVAGQSILYKIPGIRMFMRLGIVHTVSTVMMAGAMIEAIGASTVAGICKITRVMGEAGMIEAVTIEDMTVTSTK